MYSMCLHQPEKRLALNPPLMAQTLMIRPFFFDRLSPKKKMSDHAVIPVCAEYSATRYYGITKPLFLPPMKLA